MLTITYNGEPCMACGHDVRQLVVGGAFTRGGKTYVGNYTMPCGCVHSMTPIAVFEDELRAARERV